jgi:glycogenin
MTYVRPLRDPQGNHKHNLDKDKYNLQGEKYQLGINRWSRTCTKFAAWSLTQFERVVFMDSDMLVVAPIDDALYEFTNASFAAAPECFPPDTFNSGFMVLNPSLDTLERLEQLNEDVGSAEGGDQGVFNNGLCPQWFRVGPDDKDCGRLPWIFNVEAAYFNVYKTLREMTSYRPISVIHFVSDGKVSMNKSIHNFSSRSSHNVLCSVISTVDLDLPIN